MSKIDINDLLKVINVLSPSEEENQEQNSDPKGGDPKSKPKTEEEIRAEILAELEAAKKSKEGDPQEDPQEDPKEDPQEDREIKHINRAIKTGLKDADVDDSVAKQLSSFVNYDTLKNEEGEADDEKINSFVELVSSVARRVPPKGAPKSGASDDGGFGKYLQDK